MSDRASNEKKADVLLNEWRDKVLDECSDETERTTVLQFHCMAHVLLGFHRYVCDDLKKWEKDFVTENGPIGRDNLPAFKFWSKQGTVIERVVRTTSDIFGPVGDHFGVRDRWEAYCASKGIKSTIGNYKDNRFNGLFQTAAEVYLHQEDFSKVLKTVEAPNRKLKSVLADLESETVKTLLKCLGLVYIKITGPYWWFVTSSSVSYLELYPYMMKLEQFLQDCQNNPHLLVDDHTFWIYDDELSVPHQEKFSNVLFDGNPSEALLELIPLICQDMLRTMRKQLQDFLEGGRYSTTPTKEDLARTSFAHNTNLGCEHHFGDLDSSQKRRPNASFHHHSSVQMIKRNCTKLIKWLNDMPQEKQIAVMKLARKGGRDLRKRHREEEQLVSEEILKNMNTQPKKRKKIARDLQTEFEVEDDEEDYTEPCLPKLDHFIDNDYVAVAYQDTWYPGCVINSNSDGNATVKFMIPCKVLGTYKWPARPDVQEVEKQFVLKAGLLPECRNSGRQWYFSEFVEIEKLYSFYKEKFFS